MADQPRIVVALQHRNESSTVADWLGAAGFDVISRPTSRSAAEEMEARPFDLLIADAAFVIDDGLRPGARICNARTPILMVGDAACSSRADALGELVMHVVRPLEHAAFMCFVSMAMLEGRPTRRSVRKPVNSIPTFMNGAPVRLIDVSNEGLRLEIAAGQAILPPYFAVRVPFLGVNVTVQRKWTKRSTAGAVTIWCGAALAQNRASAEQAWRSFVDTIPVAQGTIAPAADV